MVLDLQLDWEALIKVGTRNLGVFVRNLKTVRVNLAE